MKLSSTGQLVIPKAIRQAMGLRPGAQLHVQLDQGKIVIMPVSASRLEALYDKYPNAGFLAELEAEHRGEIGDEAAICA